MMTKEVNNAFLQAFKHFCEGYKLLISTNDPLSLSKRIASLADRCTTADAGWHFNKITVVDIAEAYTLIELLKPTYDHESEFSNRDDFELKRARDDKFDAIVCNLGVFDVKGGFEIINNFVKTGYIEPGMKALSLSL